MKLLKFVSLTSCVAACFFLSSCSSEQPKIQESVVIDCDAPYHGIDVSHHNKSIDWVEVAKDDNIKFVYIKATEGATYVDKSYHTNIAMARKAGLKVGSYHFFRMTSSPEDQLENMKKHIIADEQDFIPMIDVETTDGRQINEVRNSLRKFLKLVEEHYGVKPAIYGTNRSYNQICGNTFNDHVLYLGRYGSNPPVIKGREHYSIWQFSEKGTINGIKKPVDLCKFHPDCDLRVLEFRH